MPPWRRFAPSVGQKAPSVVLQFFLSCLIWSYLLWQTALYVVYYNTCYRLVVSLYIKMHKYGRKLQNHARVGVLPHATLSSPNPRTEQHQEPICRFAQLTVLTNRPKDNWTIGQTNRQLSRSRCRLEGRLLGTQLTLC